MKSFLRSTRPPATPDPGFVDRLTTQLSQLNPHQVAPHSMPLSRTLAITGASTLLVAAVATVAVTSLKPAQPSEVVTRTASSFGTLQAAPDLSAKGSGGETATATNDASYGRSDLTVMPEQYQQIVYTIPEYELPTESVVAYKRTVPTTRVSQDLTGGFFASNPGGEVKTFSFTAQGYTIDLNYETASIYGSLALAAQDLAISSKPMDTNPAAEDGAALSGTTALVSRIGLRLEDFAAPVVLPKDEGEFAWNRRTVVYPEQVEGLSLVNYNGDVEGANFTVAPDGSVETFAAPIHRFEKASYAPVTDRERVASFINPSYGTPSEVVTRTLGAPTRVLSTAYTSTGSVILVESLRFAVLDAAPGERKAVIVPLAADLFTEQLPMPGVIEPAVDVLR